MKKVKLAIDFGSANMKMAGIIDGKIYKKIIKSQATTNKTSKLSDKNIVEYNNKSVYFGVGNPLVKKNKTEREFVIESILLATNAIYGELDNKFEVQLGIGLPLDKYTSQEKDIYLNSLKTEYLNKSIKGVVDGKEIAVTITYINIYAEGYSGFISLAKRINTKNPLLIIDVGYKTTDIVGIKYDTFSDALLVDNNITIPKGMLEILETITEQFNADTQADYSVETIEDAIITNRDIQYATSEGLETRNISRWLKYGDEVLSYIFNTIEIKAFPDWKNRNLYFIGGGVNIINCIMNEMINKDRSKTVGTEELKDDEEDIVISKNDNSLMYANVKGYLIQLNKDVIDIVESEDVFVPDSKLDKSKKTVAVTEE